MTPESFLLWYNSLPQWLVLLLSIWTLVWKGFALWKSSKKNSPIWFIILLVVNTLGILEILYLFIFSKMQTKLEQIKTTGKNTKRKSKK